MLKIRYLLRDVLVTFFNGAATASFACLYVLHEDYKFALESFTQQMKDPHESLDSRISYLEKLKPTAETSQQVEATE